MNSLNEPNSVALTRATAEKYFGSWENAIGKLIQFQNSYILKVNGILENIPDNSDFPFTVVISFKTRKETDNAWSNVNSSRQCFIQIPENSSALEMQNLMPAFEKKHFPVEDAITGHFVLQPLSNIHFDARYGNLNGRTISKSTLLSLGFIGVFLLVTASINFINLAIAQIVKKSREVGVRKVLGSNRNQLIGQFFGETFIILLFSAALGVVLTVITLPKLKPVLNLPLNFNPINSETILFLFGLIIVLTLFAGVYPAGVMARLKPVLAMKSKISSHNIGGVSLRKGLIVVQFTIAQILVIVTMVIFLQLDFFQSAPLGFDKESILYFSIPSDSTTYSQLEPLRNSLLQQAEIKSASFSLSPPSWGGNTTTTFRFDQSQKDEPFEVNQKYADVDFFKTYGISIIAGRIYQVSDTPQEYVVNETFIKKLGKKTPEEIVGKNIAIGGTSHPIVGVMKDFNVRSLRVQIEPVVISSNSREYHFVGMKIYPQKLEQAIKKVERIHAAFFPTEIFEYHFLGETLARSYIQEQRISTLTNIFSGIAIFISCLGLYGLISFMAVQRTKEVGIRKVLGASVPDILFLFSKEFIVLVLIAFVVAVPVATYFMESWLNGFAYHINLSVWIFLVSIAGTTLIALLTLSFQSIKAALTNPVDSLRTE